jgi:excisionase family DNA binding protein
VKLRKEFYTIPEAAELLCVHPNTIRRRIKDGSLPACQRPYKWYIAAEDLKRFTAPTNVQRAK